MPYSKEQARAIIALKRAARYEDLEALELGLQNPDPVIRWWAAHRLERVGTEAALAALLPATDDADSSVRLTAVAALAKARNPAALPIFRALLHDPEPPVREWGWGVREWALEGLGHVSPTEAAEHFVALLESDRETTRRWAERWLRRHGRLPSLAPEPVRVRWRRRKKLFAEMLNLLREEWRR